MSPKLAGADSYSIQEKAQEFATALHEKSWNQARALIEGLGDTEKNVFAQELLQTDAMDSDRYGNTALHYAAKEGYEDVVSTLLSAYKTPGSSNRFGQTPLQNAAMNGHQGVVSILLKAYRPVVDLENNPSDAQCNTGDLDVVLLDTPAEATYLDSLKLAKTEALITGKDEIAKMIENFINKKTNLRLLANELVAARNDKASTPFKRLVSNQRFEPRIFRIVGKFLSS
jgi:ankyrin repeat protein